MSAPVYLAAIDRAASRANVERDLLAALQRARGYIKSDYTAADGTDLTGGLIAQMDAAIAKALGS